MHANYAPIARLEEAKRMEAEGKFPGEIWDRTGWMKGKDGRWRWEIPDYLDRIDLEQLKDLGDDEACYLSDIYRNVRLYDAYPWLGDVMVVTRDIEGTTLGFASRDTEGRPCIGINRKWLDGTRDREIRETVIHEIQHLIQEREGFARGGNPQHVVQQVRKEIDKLKAWLNETPERKTYVDMLEEVNRLWDEDEEGKAWEAAEEKLEAYEKNLSEEEINTVSSRLNTLHDLQSAMENTTRPEDLYWNLAGEEEAREASWRAGRREDVRAHYSDALDRSLRYREEMREGMKDAPEADRKRLEQFLDEREKWRPDNQKTEEEENARLDRWDETEEWITGGALPENVAEAYSNYDLAWRDLGYTQREEQKLRDRPYIHGEGAVVVMNGQELPFSYMSPEEQLRIDENQFASEVDKVISGKSKKGSIRVMTTPLVLNLVGAKVLPIEISTNKMWTILEKEGKEKGHKESISPELMKQIPREITDPLFIAKSYSGKKGDRKIMALDLKDKAGATIVVIFELNRIGGKYAVNDIRSVYGKTKKGTSTPDFEWLIKQFTEYHTVEYVNKKKTINWIHNEKLETLMPYESSDGLFNSIKADENDLVKLKQQNPTYYQKAWHGSGAQFDRFDISIHALREECDI